MKHIKWLASLAYERPIIFGVVLLLIGVTTLFSVVRYEEKKIVNCQLENQTQQHSYETKLDSSNKVCNEKVAEANLDLKQTLQQVISSYRTQLSEQQEVNKSFRRIIKKRKR